jgi:hypothetical protein
VIYKRALDLPQRPIGSGAFGGTRWTDANTPQPAGLKEREMNQTTTFGVISSEHLHKLFYFRGSEEQTFLSFDAGSAARRNKIL